MADFKWTKEQSDVITLRDRNILVSAAAGSGKTAVLVQRIIKRITDDNPPVDIDRILVVTFTNAAAAEMKGRIEAAIEEKKEAVSEEDLKNRLDIQASLIHNAHISTIDSFCLYVLRNHFGELNLDPNFRIADEGEMTLLKNDVLETVFESNYAREDNQAFLKLIDAYASTRNDSKVKDMILDIQKASSSHPWPKEWILSLKDMYHLESTDQLKQNPIITNLIASFKIDILDAKKNLEYCLELAGKTEGLQPYVDPLAADIEILDKAAGLEDFDSLRDFAINPGFVNLGRAKKGADEKNKTYIQESLKNIKANFKGNYAEKNFAFSLEDTLLQLHRMRETVDALVDLSLEYIEELDSCKLDRHMMEFSDVEHFALRILMDENTKEATATALEFRNNFEEIMIDEYQDSNEVQEAILTTISRMDQGSNNMFMVGDVKQSIYKFRLAKPEIFTNKYQTYTTSPSTSQRIDLAMNFRSRKAVLDFANDIFYKIMSGDLGGVTYDDTCALYHPDSVEEPDIEGLEPEVLLIDEKDQELAEIMEEEDLDKNKAEARLIAQRIQELVGHQEIYDKKKKEMRLVTYSDIVLLARAAGAVGDTYAKVLNASGVPAYVESRTGYFSAYEVELLLNMLELLDNPYQDIPMAAVLKSPVLDLDDEEMAEIAIYDRDKGFAASAIEYIKASQEDKLIRAYETYKLLRQHISDTPIHLVIQKVLEETGLMDIVRTMPAGLRRKQNLNMLMEKAIAFEKTSYKGVFHFVRYIKNLRKYDIDFGEAEVMGESADVVRIMSIHKSKGLEFPVVFVINCGRSFNSSDAKNELVIHSDLKLGLDELTVNPRTKRKCLVRSQILEQIKRENLGEELRILYVALTRAVDKLIITGCIKDASKLGEKYTGNTTPKQPISFKQRLSANNFLDWIIPALYSYEGKYDIIFADARQMAGRAVEEEIDRKISREELLSRIESADQGRMEELTSKFDFVYPNQTSLSKKVKYSVSELKKESMVENYDRQQGLAQAPEFLHEKKSCIPVFMLEDDQQIEEVNKGALKGTATHRVMECLDFKAILDIDLSEEKVLGNFVEDQIKRMFEKRLITEDMLKLIWKKDIESFVKSDLAQRMAKADARGELFREKPFVMQHEDVLIQGIIDAFWLEGDQIILLDYKTDKVENAKELITRYKTQMDLYMEALTKVFTTEERVRKASESIIYSFRLKETIKL